MTVENIKSDIVTNLEAAPSVVQGDEYGGVLRFWEDTDTTTGTTTTSGSTYKLMPLPSTARLRSLSVLGDGTIDLPDVDVGLYHESGDSTYVDDDCIATGLDIDDTGDHYAIDPTLYTSDPGKMLWEYVSGLTEDPGGLFYIMLSLDADAVVAGSFKVRAEGIL